MKCFAKGIIIFVITPLLVGVIFICRFIAAEPLDYYPITGPCHLTFPKDHGPHPGYRTEWWYYTGNLQSLTGKRYGFQLTFFRRQISPPGADNKWPTPPSAWRTQQIYLAHAAISDISKNQHLQAEQVSREALNLAGASQTKNRTVIFLNDWSTQIEPNRHLLKVIADDFSFEFVLVPAKPLVLHGREGYSLKGATSERASCYYSYTRLETEGNLSINGRTIAVKGSAWMDHEFSSALLEPDLKGWDWFCLQFSDQTEFMAFLLRKEKGGISSASGGTFVDRHGKTRQLANHEFAVTLLDTWKSPHSKAVYPSHWRLQIFPYSLDLLILPGLLDQEMRTFKTTDVIYWEGSVSANGTKDGRPIKGVGYVELTGYASRFDLPM
ncbi:MAG: carotenoid 1,2-hydratase [Desulfobacterales bacterium]|nr:carotenoid 1,2-hydratase [Desulfobacterales bacterium]